MKMTLLGMRDDCKFFQWISGGGGIFLQSFRALLKTEGLNSCFDTDAGSEGFSVYEGGALSHYSLVLVV